MRRIVVATPGYLKRHGEPKTPEALLAHQTIAFGPSANWRFVQDGRDIEVAPIHVSPATAPTPPCNMPRPAAA